MSKDALSVTLSSLAFGVSCVSAFIAYRKNRNDLSAPWVQILLRHVEDEFKALDRHGVAFRRLCSLPFADPERKYEVVGELNRAREESLQRLSSLTALIPAAEAARQARVELDRVSDSYFANDALSLPQAAATDLERRYSAQQRAYSHALRKLAQRIWEREAL